MQQPLEEQANSTIDGLEDIFVSSRHADTSVTQYPDTTDVSVVEAARLLGITERSVWRRIQAGKLKSKQYQGKTTVSICQTDIKVTPQDRHDDTSVAITVGQTDTSEHQLEKLLELLKEKDKELQAATFRNGYLEAQLRKSQRADKAIDR